MHEITLEQQKVNRKTWAAALRSGMYKQAKGSLEDREGGFCCLGVLAKLAGCERIPITNSGGPAAATYDDDLGYAPPRAKEWVGLKSSSGDIGNFLTVEHDDGSCTTNSNLAEFNDGGCDFNDIAAIIEAEPEGLFIE